MVIGNGSLAKLLNDRDGFVFLACGISNSMSMCTKEERYREMNVIHTNVNRANLANDMLVYFSTISVFTVKSNYTQHKINMEASVRNLYRNHAILRLGNIWECTNPHTFINAYKAKPYEPRDEYRYMISKEQLNFITDNLPTTGKHEISIFGEMKLVKDCL